MTDPLAASSSHQKVTPPGGSRVVSDGELLVAIAAGDREAFGELYERYSRAAFGLALGRLGDRGRAEDAVQETFASVWRAASSYRPERGPGAPWLFTVARNAITTQWRRTKPEELGDMADEAALELGPDEQAEQAWRSFCVHRSLEVLTGEQRQLIELGYWQGLSQSEIAARLGLPLGTVKTRTRAALSRLAAALKEDLQ
ncbi:MAG TPA: sigma-70 family RNA polymerase sigma factor [Gaiellaceae bacterium]|jgi:RNA polymerase sigma-70 factor (ECF subfamily)|nr:sigma-70 family RNA polymerase sigma factor [Gaiellaceae bacterium]